MGSGEGKEVETGNIEEKARKVKEKRGREGREKT